MNENNIGNSYIFHMIICLKKKAKNECRIIIFKDERKYEKYIHLS